MRGRAFFALEWSEGVCYKKGDARMAEWQTQRT